VKQSTPQVRIGGNTLLQYVEGLIKQQQDAGKIDAAQVAGFQPSLDFLRKLARSAPRNFVGMAKMIYQAASEGIGENMPPELRTPAFRAVLPHFMPFAHALIFSPPKGVPVPSDRMREDLGDFSAFVTEFCEEKDRGAALVGAALVDRRLKQLLESHLISGKTTTAMLKDATGILGSLSARTELAYVLGLISLAERQECDQIARIRNLFAHELHGLTFESAEVARLCVDLKGYTAEGSTPREQYVNSVIVLCMVLWYRPEHAAGFKADRHEWPWHLA
jgi:mannitol operon repressor